jgi:hypothetical protein
MGKSKAKKKGTSDAPAANKKQKCSLIEFYAQSLKNDESLKKNFVAAGSYQQVTVLMLKVPKPLLDLTRVLAGRKEPLTKRLVSWKRHAWLLFR